MITFFKKLFKRGDFMTRADKWYYKKVFKTWLWSAFVFVIIAWVGTNLVLCALTTNVKSGGDIIYTPARDVNLPLDYGTKIKTSQLSVYQKIKTITFDYYTPEISQLVNGVTPETISEDDDIKIYRLHNGEDVYILSHNNMHASYFQEVFSDLTSLISISFNNFAAGNIYSMYGCFFYCEKLEYLDLSGWDTSTAVNMGMMFSMCTSLKTIKGIENWDVGKVTSIWDMFFRTDSLSGTLDLSGWNTSSLREVAEAFYSCGAETINLSGWDTSKITSMARMFESCGANLVGLENWDVHNVTSMHRLFWATELKEADLSKWDVSNVTDMGSMFSGCLVDIIDLRGWDTHSVENMNEMFSWSSVQTIYASENFVTTNVTSSTNMFWGCESLVGGNGTTYDSEHRDAEYARIDDPDNGRPGYFTEK